MWLGNLYWDGGKTLNEHVRKDTTCFTLVGHFILWHAEMIMHADNVVQYKYGCVRAKGRTKLDESILLKGPDSDIKPVMRSKSLQLILTDLESDQARLWSFITQKPV